MFMTCLCADYGEEGQGGPSYASVTIEPPIYEVDDPEDQEIVDLLLTEGTTPRGPQIITTPPPKVTKKKMKYVHQRAETPRKSPHWNPVGETARQHILWIGTLPRLQPPPLLSCFSFLLLFQLSHGQFSLYFTTHIAYLCYICRFVFGLLGFYLIDSSY